LYTSFHQGGKLLVAGNGGSAADADHIVAELMKSFCQKRPLSQSLSVEAWRGSDCSAVMQNLLKEDDADWQYLSAHLQGALPSIALHNHSALSTAFANDVDFQLGFAQQLFAYVRPQDCFMAISTSGNAKNLYYASLVAKAASIPVLLLTGQDGGRLRQLADIVLAVPETETYKIQELHLPLYHCLALMLEDAFFVPKGKMLNTDNGSERM